MRIDFIESPKAIRDAIAGVGASISSELYQVTGLELREAIAGIFEELPKASTIETLAAMLPWKAKSSFREK